MVTLATLAGLLNGIAFISFGPAALVANVPLLLALGRARRPRSAALAGGWVGLLGGMHIYGILDYGWLLFVGFSVYTASQMVLYALLHRTLVGRFGALFDVLLPALLWTLTEWIRTLGPLAMPASYVGCIADTPWLAPWLWLAPWIGGLGVSSLIALTQSTVFHLLFSGTSHRRPALGAAAALLLAGGLGALLAPDLGEAPVRVAGVQGGLANTQYKAAQADELAARDIFLTYEALTRRAYADRPALVVWPETAVRTEVIHHPEHRARLAPPPGTTLIAGLLHRETHAGRPQAWNLAVAFGPAGVELGRYAKVRTVPRTEAYLTRGTTRAPLATPAGRVGVLICLESVYPEAGRETVRQGAELLTVLSNDSGFGTSPITRHMTQRAIVQAVENGRWLLRVGQAGITTLIDPRGRTHGDPGLFNPAVLTGEARLRTDLTLATRLGDWWMLPCGLALAWALGARLRRRTSA